MPPEPPADAALDAGQPEPQSPCDADLFRPSRDGRYLLWEQRTPESAGNLSELLAVRADAAPAQPLASVDWWHDSGVKPTVLVRMADREAGKLRWVEGR